MGDQTAISNLIYEYARLIDSGDFAGIGELFKRGKIIFKDSQQITEISGSKAIKELYEKTTRLYDGGTPRTHHATTNITLDIDSNFAYTFSYFTVFQQLENLPLHPIIAGSYEDTFLFEDDEWHFLIREIKVSLVGDISQHLLIPLS
ncbi:MAG: nuclear transport factor 2 family protein [Actinomycetota bacterium]|nr:nuclear transport factor 2 family protein [Actinomycetota bacterium]